MRYHALASDYDGTLAHNGRVDAKTIENLKSLLASGRRLILVTGRELPELLEIFPEIELFEWVVAENGALLYRPSTKEEKPLADPPSERFIQVLKSRNVAPMSVGRVIVATWEPHETAVLETIRDLGLELQVIFNKGAVMILPTGVNKASGLKAALKEMGLSPHNVVGVGDAENDHALLRFCEFSCAVSNALPALKETADFVATADHGAGVSQLMGQMVEEDLRSYDEALNRHHLKFGKSGDQEVKLSPYGRSILICGPSASGKSTIATRIVESLIDQKYQFCLIDPEGDYTGVEGTTVFGGPKSPLVEDEILKRLEDPYANVVVSLTGLPIPERPPFFLGLMAKLLQMRTRVGRPHWLILDEAHHLMPADWKPTEGMLPDILWNTLLVTVHPELLAPTLLERLNTVLAVGQNAGETTQQFAELVKEPRSFNEIAPLKPGEVLVWNRDGDAAPMVVKVDPCRTQRLRHSRKYAEGELPPERSFFFKGREGKMNLRAQNLILFLQLGDGIDDETWTYHLSNGDYAKWFRESIKDENLAAAAERIASLSGVTPRETRKLIRQAIEQDYTLPASLPLPVPAAS
jgi:hydroxymethylpyrimidine pyrophosphatase-like HAD family hydrolase